jgi:uncharacterized protein YjbI with pentapeptide repeats
MKIIKPLSQGLLHKVFEDGQRFYLSVGILGFFTYETNSGLLSEIDLWKLAAAELGKDGMLDMCMPKPKGEVLVVGRCFAPEGQPVTAAQVRLAIGPIDKTLYVVGDRFWVGKGPRKEMTEPVPFTEMPVAYENAFGGPDFERNPLGKGHVPLETDEGEEMHPLPNIELPGALIDSRRSEPEPAGFGPIDLMWPQRMAKAGTYDKKWQKELFPGLAEDIDWTFFNAAPEDQQIEGYFRGDEPFEIEGMHPDKPLSRARLPGIRPRCFLNRQIEESERLEELETSLDTVWLFPHAEKGLVIHRAVVEIGTDDATDVLHLMLAYERLEDEPRTFEHYREAFRKRTDEKKAHLFLLDERDLIPPGAKSGLAALMEEARDREESPLSRNLARKAEREKEKAEESIRQMGLDPAQFIADEPQEAPEPDLENLDEIAAFAEQAEADALAKQAEIEQQQRQILAEQGIDYDDLVEQAKEQAGGPPKFSAEENIQQLRAAGINDPAMEQKLREAEETLKQTYRRFAHHFAPAPLPAADQAARMREAVIAGHREGKSFAGHDLTGADLSGLELQNVDFADAMLERANLAGADLSGADLSRCVLARADLSGAKLAGAKMTETCLGAARLGGASLAGAETTQAAFGQADLAGADLSGATLDGADFMEAKLAGADFSRAVLKETTFLENDLSGARFVEADVGQCMFINAKLEAVDFSGARLGSAVFVGVQAENIVCTGADMTKVCAANETSFAGADFRGADLSQAGMRGCDFSGCDFEGARMEMADLSECSLKQANLRGALARGARFEKSDLERADMRQVNLFEGSLMKATLRYTDLRGANLYSAECMRAVLWETDLREANLTMTKFAELAEE